MKKNKKDNQSWLPFIFGNIDWNILGK